MPKLDELYKKHIGQDIYIIGTGPSLSLFPKDFLSDKITIGLNQAYKLLSPTYLITIHPYLIPLNLSKKTCYLTKVKPSDESWSEHVKNGNVDKFYLFHKNKNPLDFSYLSPAKRPKNGLYVGCGIHTGGLHLAALMGAKTVFLIGCDFGSFGHNHHYYTGHIETHNYSAEEVYQEYWYYAIKVREELEKYYKLTVLSLSYILGKSANTELLLNKAGLTQKEPPIVIEKNVRTTPLIRNFI